MLARMEWTNDGIWSTIPKMNGQRTPIHTAGETDRQATGTSRILLQTAEKNNLRLETHRGFKGLAVVVTDCRHHCQTPRLSRSNIFSSRSPRCSHRKILRSNHTNTLRNGRCLTQRLLWVLVTTFRLSCWCEVWFSCNFFCDIFPFCILFDLNSTIYHGMHLLYNVWPCSNIDPATRKLKFFLHPDKLPKDLTKNQTQLFETLWNELQEKEALLQK